MHLTLHAPFPYFRTKNVHGCRCEDVRALTSFNCPDHPHLGAHPHPLTSRSTSAQPRAFSPLLRWATRVVALSPAPESFGGFPRLLYDVTCVLPDAHGMTDGTHHCRHPALLTVSFPVPLIVTNLIFTSIS